MRILPQSDTVVCSDEAAVRRALVPVHAIILGMRRLLQASDRLTDPMLALIGVLAGPVEQYCSLPDELGSTRH